MTFTLYRRMSDSELNKTLKTKGFIRPLGEVALLRKWFSTSLYRCHYFKSPYHIGDSQLISVNINQDFFEKIFKEGTFVKKEANGFFGCDEGSEDIIYAKAHKTIDTLFNIGFMNLEELNSNIGDIKIVDEDDYETLMRNLLPQKLEEMINSPLIENPLEFYVQIPYDAALLCIKYQTLIAENINPIIKNIHISKDLEKIEKLNLHKFKVTLKIKFKEDILKYRKFRDNIISLNASDVIKFAPLIESISVAKVLETDQNHEIFLDIKGDNEYKKHYQRPYTSYKRLSYSEFERVTLELFRKDFKITNILEYIPNLKDLYNIYQIEPKHIDSLSTHIEKAINISNLLIYYFYDKGFKIDENTLMLLKWSILVHDLGKPYCQCENIATRYTQFVGKETYLRKILYEMLDPDVSFPLDIICSIFNTASITGERKIKTLIIESLQKIKKTFNIEEQEALKYLDKYLNIAFLLKATNTSTFKTRSVCSLYVDDLNFFKTIKNILKKLYNYDYYFPYEELYLDVTNFYHQVTEKYYIEDNKTTIEYIRNMLTIDNEKLSSVFIKKNNRYHNIDEDKEYKAEELINTYLLDDNPLLTQYFSQTIKNFKAHGESHFNRVGIFSYLLGKLNNLNDDIIEILLLASKYHDIGRELKNNKNHALNSVSMLKEKHILDNYQYKDYVYFLIEAHGFDDTYDLEILNKYHIDKQFALSLVKLFKDADALDRVRFDKEDDKKSALNIKYLRNKHSLLLIKFAYQLNAMYQKDIKRNKEPLKKLLLTNKHNVKES